MDKPQIVKVREEFVPVKHHERDLEDLLVTATEYMEELKDSMKDIKVPADSNNPNVLEAIKAVFGEDFISNDQAYITYEMYLKCLQLIRSVGRDTAAEFV